MHQPSTRTDGTADRRITEKVIDQGKAMEHYEENFQEYLVLKNRARSVGVPLVTLFQFKDRTLRQHLTELHANGSPLSELADYTAAFYSISVTPQQLRKILQKSDRDTWITASESYRQHRHMKRQEAIISAIGT